MKNKSAPSDLEAEELRLIGQDCLGFNIRKAARVLGKAYDGVLAPSGLKNTQFSILTCLQSTGEMNLRDLANLLKMDRTTLTRNLRPLERRKMISIFLGTDRRVRMIEITKSGKDTLQKAIPLWRQVQERLLTAMGDRTVVWLRTGLQSLIKVAAS